MKVYQPLKTNHLVIENNNNYLVDSAQSNLTILVKSGVNTSLITYNNIEPLNLEIIVEQDSSVQMYHILESEKTNCLTEKIHLIEKGGSAKVVSVILGTGNSNIQSDIGIYHEIGMTNSDLKTYAITKDHSTIQLNNNAYIKQKASGSVAHQNAKGLSLSKESTILIDPNLFIDEYDVMASHGVAMGSLNQDDLFYLMSRGLTKESASEIVIMGFIEPLLTEIDNEEINDNLRKNFKEKLTKK